MLQRGDSVRHLDHRLSLCQGTLEKVGTTDDRSTNPCPKGFFSKVIAAEMPSRDCPEDMILSQGLACIDRYP